MHRALGAAGGAAGVEPEGRVVRAGGRGLVHRRVGLQEGLELHLGRVQRCLRVRDDDFLHLVIALDHGRGQRGQQRARHQHRLRARMLQHVGVIVGRQQGVDGHRDQPGVQRAEEGHRPVVAVVHQHQHAFFAAQVQAAQRGGHAAHALVQRAIGERAVVVHEGRLGPAGGVQRQQMLGKVEALGRRRDVGSGVHGVSVGLCRGLGPRGAHCAFARCVVKCIILPVIVHALKCISRGRTRRPAGRPTHEHDA